MGRRKLKELQEQYAGGARSAFRPAEKLEDLYRRGKEKHVNDPEEYAIKNWIVRVQGFLISCATYGFTSHY